MTQLSPTRASLMGRKGAAIRWARYVSAEQRREQTEAAREGQRQRYLYRASAMPGAELLGPREIAERARQLRLADLADFSLRALQKRGPSSKGPSGRRP